MKTTATNRKIHVLLRAIENETLVPNPAFQRRLVWSAAHKLAFVETVLMGYPFPEIYIASGQLGLDSAEGTEMLVDGQQRITTLFQYFRGKLDVEYSLQVRPYNELDDRAKQEFLEYEVVVRDMGLTDLEEIKEVFRRINLTKYSLNAMEVQNSRYEGAFKKFGDKLATHDFFTRHKVFTGADFRRMHDTRLMLIYVATILAGYFNRDSSLEEFLKFYNDEFPMENDINRNTNELFAFIDKCEIEPGSRLWNKADLLTMMIELYRIIFTNKISIEPKCVGKQLNAFSKRVEREQLHSSSEDIASYYKAAVQATNDRSNRVRRAEVFLKQLTPCLPADCHVDLPKG